MKTKWSRVCSGIVLALGGLGAAQAADNYTVVAVFDALFDTTGQVVELKPHEEAAHPAAFWDSLKARFIKLKIAPPLDATGQPATLRTGLYVKLDVTPGEKGGQVKIAGMDVQPLILPKDYAGYPQDIAKAAGWNGAVDAECLVGADGRCGEVKVKALPGMPPSVLRWATATLSLWEFKPPQINGVPFAVPIQQSFTLNTSDDGPVDFRQRGSGNAPFRW